MQIIVSAEQINFGRSKIGFSEVLHNELRQDQEGVREHEAAQQAAARSRSTFDVACNMQVSM